MVKAYWLKTETNWVGFACGKTWGELFKAIDMDLDPYSCKYIPATMFLANWKDHADPASDNCDMEYDVFNDYAPDLDDPRWKDIDWNSKPGTLYHEEEEA